MIKEVEFALPPTEASVDARIEQTLRKKLSLSNSQAFEWRLLRRSIDARGVRPLFRMRVAVFLQEPAREEPALLEQLQMVDAAKDVLIVGAGPAGYFAALELIELGLKPIVIDQGKDVRSRRRDLRAIQQFGIVAPHSNYCFGEGGAGTYSDGKLYTRSHKRGEIEKALRLLVEHGAVSDILVDAHPHIGSNKLPGVVANIRSTIEYFGGEVHFEHQLTDLYFEKGELKGVLVNGEKIMTGAAVILATGHSARDIYRMLHRRKIYLEPKPFALGIRIEHPQGLIDRIQYGQSSREEALPAASYKLVTQVEDKGVFSFCMCPGGLIVPTATAPGELVVNGMSMSRRDSPFANSGIVTAIDQEETEAFADQGVFRGLALQMETEKRIFNTGDGGQSAPAQRMTDFVKGKLSQEVGKSSYIPGVYSAPLHELLPPVVARRLQRGLEDFGRKMKGYYTEEAIVVGVESRTSSPIRIPRNSKTLMHTEVEGLFPCGEGAGYAGGIISAAMDGQNVAKAVRNYLRQV